MRSEAQKAGESDCRSDRQDPRQRAAHRLAAITPQSLRTHPTKFPALGHPQATSQKVSTGRRPPASEEVLRTSSEAGGRRPSTTTVATATVAINPTTSTHARHNGGCTWATASIALGVWLGPTAARRSSPEENSWYAAATSGADRTVYVDRYK